MMKILYRHIVLLAFLLLVGGKSMAQLIPVEDANFLQFLKDSVPQVLVGDLLDTSDASVSLVDGTIDCRDRGIVSFPEVLYFYRIDTLIASGNQLDSMGNVKNINSVDYLDVSNNRLRYLPDVRNITCEYYYCQNNLAGEIPWFTNLGATMKVMNVANNEVRWLYDYSGFVAAELIDVSNNRLTFRHLLRSVDHPDFENVWNYAPQKKIQVGDSVTKSIGESFSIDLAIDDTVTTNTYFWYKNGVIIDTTYGTVNQWSIPSVQYADAGVYHAEVVNSNPKLGLLRLVSEDIVLEIPGCFDLAAVGSVLVNAECENSALVALDTGLVSSTGSLTDIVLIDESGDSLEWNSVFEVSVSGTYDLHIADDIGCSAVSDDWLTIFVNSESVDLSSLQLKTIEAECGGLATFEFDTASLQYQGTLADVYLIKVLGDDTTSMISGEKVQLNLGNYHLEAVTDAGCGMKLENWLSIEKKEDCQLLLTPNGDGVEDNVFIDAEGTTVLYDKSGAEIATFTSPLIWDGQKSNGELISPGYYSIYVAGVRYANITVAW